MKNIKKLGVVSLAMLLVFGIAGCGKDDKPDTFTNASVTEESDYKVVSGKADDVIAAMSKYKGTYLHATVNEDESVNVGYFIYSLKKDTDGSYIITQSFGANDDGSVNQTVKNLEREKKGTAYFVSHSYGEIESTAKNVYVAVTGASAPTFATRTYYSRSGEASNYTYTLLTEQPANWATNYTDYFKVDHIEYVDSHKVDWKVSGNVVGAKMYYNVDKIDYTKDASGKTTSVRATLKVYRIDPIV